MRFGKRTNRDVAADGTAPCPMCGETVPIDISGHCELGHRVTSPEVAARAGANALWFEEDAEGPAAEGPAAEGPAAEGPASAETPAEAPAAEPFLPPAPPAAEEAVTGPTAAPADEAAPAPTRQPHDEVDLEGLLRNGSHHA